MNTLKYANRAKNIKTNATRNSLDVNHHISEYVNLIGSLRTEITRLKHQLVRGARGQGSGDSAGTNRPEVRLLYCAKLGLRRVFGGETVSTISGAEFVTLFSLVFDIPAAMRCERG